ncbi:MAG: S8 family serine peptidase [Acidobacteriia bacterium]|nr:S8 family serine peptidase [Terriglobia bacterium]
MHSMKLRYVLLGPFLAASAVVALPDTGPTSAGAPLEIDLASGTFRPFDSKASSPTWFAPATVALSASDRRYLVAITRAPLDASERRQIESAGAELLDVLPRNGYRVRVSPGAELSIRRLPFVAWLGELPRHLKIEPSLASRAGSPPGPTPVRAVLAAGEPERRAVGVLAGLGAIAAPSGKDGAWRVTATVPSGQLAAVLSALASLPEVEAVEIAKPVRPFNQDAVWVHQSFVGPSPQQTPIFDHGLFGCGQILAIADIAQDYDSCYFRDTVNGPPPVVACGGAPCPAAAPAPGRRKDILYYNWSGGPTGEEDTCPATITGTSGHGTHTSGTLAGDAAPYADCAAYTTAGRNGGDGLAPGAKLVVEEMGDGFEYLNNLGGTLWNLADVAYQTGARVHSDSWGAACFDLLGECIPGCTMPYDSYARDADLAMWSHPDLLLVAAAGNAGLYCPPPISVGTPANAKNPISVGAVGHGTSASTPSDFTSPGPVEDGRLAPTIAAQGESTVSAASDASLFSNNCASCSLDGTSMSAPTVAGLAALVREYFTAGFYPGGARNPALGFAPSAALLKAILVDGAVALGTSAPNPDFTAGYGRAQLDRTLAFAGGTFRLRVDDRREGITTGSVVTHAYDVSAGSPFRATLVWTDYPAAIGAAVARVNEIELEVVDPAGNVWFQTLDPTSGLPVPTTNPAAPHDARNVVERLVFDAPAAGRWVVRVRGVAVPWAPQPFALVVRGALADCPAPTAPGAPSLSTPADRQVLVSWGAVAGAAAYNVYRSFGPCPGGPYTPVASAVTDPSFLDTTVDGGVTYTYVVTAASDPSGTCESGRSPCASVVPAGDCTLPPSFRGIKAAESAGLPSCTVVLSWDPATAYCPGDVRYNVYRGGASTFAPGPQSRIARCLVGSSFTDSVDLVDGSIRWYVVRAEDASSGHGGPCRGGNEEMNTTALAASPDGPPTLGTWSDDAGDTGSAKMDATPPWSASPAGGHAGPKTYNASSSAGICADLATPVLVLADPGQGPALQFWTKHDLEYDPSGEIFGREGSLGQVEIAAGPSFVNWTRVPLAPNYPATVDFPFNDCATTQNPGNYFTGPQATYTAYTASLANWAGGEVKVRFHLSGDYLYPGGSWQVDDVAVAGAMVPGACASAAAGPPPIPDGAIVPGQPLRASRSGASVVLTWDASQCPAAAVDVYRGTIGNFTAFNGGACGLPPTGSATLAIPDGSWFLVAATDGGSADGSYGRTISGSEIVYAGASAACPGIVSHVTNNACP